MVLHFNMKYHMHTCVCCVCCAEWLTGHDGPGASTHTSSNSKGMISYLPTFAGRARRPHRLSEQGVTKEGGKESLNKSIGSRQASDQGPGVGPQAPQEPTTPKQRMAKSGSRIVRVLRSPNDIVLSVLAKVGSAA